MSSIDLIPLIDEAEGSSVGVSRLSSMTPWGLEPFEVGTVGVDQFQSFSWTLSRSTSKENVLRRFACHILIELIPDLGLNELFDTLIEMRDFYKDASAREHQALEAPRLIELEITGTRTRPEIAIDTEDLWLEG